MPKITTHDILSQLGIEVGKPFLFRGDKTIIRQIDEENWLMVENDGVMSRWFVGMLIDNEIEIIQQPKYTLTETEKHIVLAIDSRWKWLTRVAYGCLELTSEKPIKTSLGWGDVFAKRAFDMFHHHFQFIQWSDEEPVSLDELREIAKK